jgi:hypothetical protein
MGHLQITGCPSLIIFEITWRAFFDQKNNPKTLYYGAECGFKFLSDPEFNAHVRITFRKLFEISGRQQIMIQQLKNLCIFLDEMVQRIYLTTLWV